MALSTKYDPSQVEDKWYQHWLDQQFFHSTPNPEKEPYVVVIPPPNVTGVLHMGHMLNNTIQDVLVRKARMEGKEAVWVPGTDHASIATEAKVVKMLAEQGIDKREIGREKFLEHAFEWKEKYGGIILKQLRKLGASCDWDRTAFTMNPDYYQAVIDVFVDLYDKGEIYRGYRMGNWDPQGRTALADDEVIHREEQSKLYHVKYQVEGSNEWLTIATTRPETIMADTAICIHPEDERYTHLHGKRAIVPLVNRSVPIIQDEYVTMDFGTGCLKVTPAHDENDYNLGMKHNLEIIDILDETGHLNAKAQFFVGEDRFVARKMVAKELKKQGHLVKEEDYMSSVGHSERTEAVVEPRLSEQWYVKMNRITEPARENVLNDVVQLVPPKFKNMYRSWMDGVRDWCISRQLWWGHRIPAYYLPNGEYVVARNAEEALEKAKAKDPSISAEQLEQDPDVLDTWFSAWLWPIEVFKGMSQPDNEEIKYYYPTNDLVTAPEILFFWVARMVIAGYEYMGEKPFKNVYLTGIVRDKQRRKMSKSLGNSPDPLELIKQFGADAIRTGMLFSSPAGNDLLYDEKLVEQGRNFANKIWNAYRLFDGFTVDESLDPTTNQQAIDWFESRFNQGLNEINDHFSKFRMSDALMSCYKLIWGDFCSWYLEMVKPDFEKPVDSGTYEATKNFFNKVLRVVHPFMPFISEELWHYLEDRSEQDCITVAAWPESGNFNEEMLAEANTVFDVVSQIRNLRSSKGLSPKEAFDLQIKPTVSGEGLYNRWEAAISKLANVSSTAFVDESEAGAVCLVVKGDEIYVPLGESMDVDAEREKLTKELEYNQGFLKSVQKKLSNERFVNNAPEAVVAAEKKKQADAEAKIKALEESLAKLG
ncbi:MAG TPA: valine--tRNA ligase [Cytophagales bacterium]|nr:valine--tRNA ligase [Cytophagales bacterium]HAA21980.1 valine--tRNA ligase [Cytophagales bacterium]HAP63797.1 valine--tRNA ligase [Cytophagales bacterium]